MATRVPGRLSGSDGFVNETMECLWINFFIPSLVAEEVQAANEMVVETVDKLLDGAATSLGPQADLTRSLLNAPDYLFVSTNVAKAFPELIESAIISEYSTFLPGNIASSWQQGKKFNRVMAVQVHRPVRYAAVTASLGLALSLLQYAAATPYLLQRMFVRFCQPFFLSAFVFLFSILVESPVSAAVLAVGLAVLIGLLIAGRYRQSSTARKIQPVPQESDGCDESIGSVSDPSPSASSPMVSDNDDDSISFSLSFSEGTISPPSVSDLNDDFSEPSCDEILDDESDKGSTNSSIDSGESQGRSSKSSLN